MAFSKLGLSKELISSIASQKYSKAYPIQESSIPDVLAGRDLLAIAPTGTGKTASFVWPILDLLQKKESSKNRHISTLVLVPTRELAVQVHETFRLFGNPLSARIKTLAVYGGVSINPQMMALQGVEVLVATPGRLLELVSSNAVSLSAVRILVLDEADKMLNMGFKEELSKLFLLLPKKRQSLLYSATLSEELMAMNKDILQNPVVKKVDAEVVDLALITQLAYSTIDERKGPLLRYLIKSQEMKQVLVFTSSIHKADSVALKLTNNGINATAIHSKKSQGARMEALKLFKNNHLKVLVATDLMARGIDIKDLPVVINYELPRSPKDYVHRIGRTGRAGSAGHAITLVSPSEEHHFKVIQKKTGKVIELIETKEINLHGY